MLGIKEKISQGPSLSPRGKRRNRAKFPTTVSKSSFRVCTAHHQRAGRPPYASFHYFEHHDGSRKFLIPLRSQLVAQAFQPVQAQAKACGYQ